MLRQDIRSQILKLISEYNVTPKIDIEGVPGSYAALQHACITDELTFSVRKLRLIFQNDTFNEEKIKTLFKALCIVRFAQDHSYSNSYAAMPEGACNDLCWQIAEILFEPKNLREMITIILPDIKYTVNLISILPKTQHNSHLFKDRFNIEFDKQRLDALEYKQCDSLKDENNKSRLKSGLSECIIIDNYVFPVEEIQQLPFWLHIKIYDYLSRYPKLKEKLYSHNEDLAQLRFDIDLVSENSITPNEALNRFIIKLKLAGHKYSGKGFAADSALFACAQFRAYLDRLPANIRKTIESLKTSQGDTLAWIMEQLKEGECVETCAEYFESLQCVKTNLAVLNKQPQINTNERQKLEEKYIKKPLQLSGTDNTTALPLSLKQKVYPQIKINSAADCIDLLLNLPPAEYADIIKYGEVNQELLDSQLTQAVTMFTAEQRSAFLLAVINNADKFGRKSVLLFCLTCGDPAICTQAYALIEPAKRFAAIYKKDRYGHSGLHCATQNSNPEVVRMTLALFRESDYFAAITRKNAHGVSVLHFAATNPNHEIIRLLLNSMPERSRLNAAKQKTDYGRTVLHDAATNSNPQVLRMVLDLYPENERYAAVKMKTRYDGYTALHYAADNRNPDIFRTVLMLYPEKERLTVIEKKNEYNECVLDFAEENDNPLVLQTLRSIYLTTLQVCAFKKIYQSLYDKSKSFQINFLAAAGDLPTYDMEAKIKACCSQPGSVFNSLVKTAWMLTLKHTKFGNLDKLEKAYKKAMKEYNAEYRQTHPTRFTKLLSVIPGLFSHRHRVTTPAIETELEERTRARPPSANMN